MPVSSVASSICRCELGRSRALAVSLGLLGALAAASALLSALNFAFALGVAGSALGWSLLLAQREWRRPPQVWLLQDVGEPVSVIENGEESHVTLVAIAFRGPFVLLRWRDANGTSRARAVWPDALCESERRALRRRFGSGGESPTAGMAG